MFSFGLNLGHEFYEKVGNPVVEWGGRGIYHPAEIDLWALRKADKYANWSKQAKVKQPAWIDIPYDRQQMSGSEDPEIRKSFSEWLNKKALPALKAWCTKEGISESSRKVFVFQEGNRVLTASCNASFGYMYMMGFEWRSEQVQAAMSALAEIQRERKEGWE